LLDDANEIPFVEGCHPYAIMRKENVLWRFAKLADDYRGLA
jgi:hypothetical protein